MPISTLPLYTRKIEHGHAIIPYTVIPCTKSKTLKVVDLKIHTAVYSKGMYKKQRGLYRQGEIPLLEPQFALICYFFRKFGIFDAFTCKS